MEIPFDKVYKEITVYLNRVTSSSSGNLTILVPKTQGVWQMSWSTLYAYNASCELRNNKSSFHVIKTAPENNPEVLPIYSELFSYGASYDIVHRYSRAVNLDPQFKEGYTSVVIGSSTSGLTFTGGRIIVEGIPK